MLSPKEKKFLKLYLAKLNPQELAEKMFLHIEACKLTIPLFEIYQRAGVDLSLESLFKGKAQLCGREFNLLEAYQKSCSYSSDLFEIKIFKKLLEQIPEAQKGKLAVPVLANCLLTRVSTTEKAIEAVIDLAIPQLAKECAQGQETNFLTVIKVIEESSYNYQKQKKWINFLLIQKEQRVLSLLLAPEPKIVLAKEKAFKL